MRRFMFAIAILVATLIPSSSLFADQAAKGRSAAAKTRATAASPVNLNSASITQLQTLPGIGASAAQRIVDYRQKNGSFKKIEELMNVKGIGEKSFLKLKPLITVSADKADHAGGQK
jgi:comEA protein